MDISILKYIIFIFFIFTIESCSSENKMNEINRINEDESDVVEKEDSLKIMYFPSEIGNVNYWFSEQLHALEEPILYKYRSKEIESYRYWIQEYKN